MATLDIECLLVFNDFDRETVELLTQNVAPRLADIRQSVPRLHLKVEYRNAPFELAYPEIKRLVESGGFQNVLFNLDQYGHSKVDIETVRDIITSFASAEVFYTFGISSLLAFLQSSNPSLLTRQLGRLGVGVKDMSRLEGLMNKDAWLGIAEQLVFESFRRCASYVSPFSINNPDGWRYWLIHLATSHRARQEYNNVLHQNKSSQAHFGRSGLNMLSYDPSDAGGMLYVFDEQARKSAREQLYNDIPNLVSRFGDVVSMEEFYGAIYNQTPAHMDDIHFGLIENPDLEVITEAGGERQKANTIRASDTIRMKRQRSFFQIFANAGKTET